MALKELPRNARKTHNAWSEPLRQGRQGGMLKTMMFWERCIALRIWSAVVMPIGASILTSVLLIVHLLSAISEAERISSVTHLMTDVSSLIYEMQKERGLSVALTHGSEKGLADRFQNQILATNHSRRRLEMQIAIMLPRMPASVKQYWYDAGVTDTRPALSDAAATVYTKQIDALIGFEERLSVFAAHPDVDAILMSALDILQAEEAAGVERATGMAIIEAKGTESSTQKKILERMINVQEDRLHAFRAVAIPFYQQELTTALTGVSEVSFEKDQSLLRQNDALSNQLDTMAWFDLATARLDRLHHLQTDLVRFAYKTAQGIDARTRWQFKAVVWFMAGTMPIGLLVIFLLTKGVSSPVTALTGTMRRLSSGENKIDIPFTERPDELGDMARAVLVFQEQALAVEQMKAEAEQCQKDHEAARQKAMTIMAEAIESRTGEVIRRVIEESGRINDTACRMAESALKVEQTSGLVAAAAEQSMANAQTVAGAAEQLSASIHEIAGQVSQSRQIVGKAVTSAGNVAMTVTHLTAAMAAIDDVVHVIADIAGQTNLLALNATIEAARTGEAGKGFTVVAQEVKSLSMQTARQTEDIRGKIETLKTMAKQVAESIAGMVEEIHSVEAIASGVAAAVEEQNAATNEISRNIQQSATASADVTDKILYVAKESSATGKQAANVETLLGGMFRQVDELGRVLTYVVRTTNPEVNRRANEQRVPLVASFTGNVGGIKVAGRTLDLSTGGAALKIIEGKSAMTPGARGEIDIEKVGRIPVSVKAVSHIGTHIGFVAPSPSAIRAIVAVQEQVKQRDASYIEIASNIAVRIASGFEEALKTRQITEADLFSLTYAPIAGTDPVQVLAPHTNVAEQVIKPLIDLPLAADPCIALCCACDRSGYIAAHNSKYSEPQRPGDLAWNMVHSRNRRIYDDRTGSAAAWNTQPFLVQIYPRDMGGGQIVFMKEFDTPIVVANRHWGNVRLAINLE